MGAEGWFIFGMFMFFGAFPIGVVLIDFCLHATGWWNAVLRTVGALAVVGLMAALFYGIAREPRAATTP